MHEQLNILNLCCPINSLGYGVAGTQIAKALQDNGVKLSLFPINNTVETEPENNNWLREIIPTEAGGLPESRANFPDFFSPCLKVWHPNNMALMVGHGPHIGFPIFELDTFTEIEDHHLFEGCDYIFVCSEWAKEIVIQNYNRYVRCTRSISSDSKIDHKVFVIPLGVDRKVFYDEPLRDDNKTIFLNCGKWEIRKGHDVLVKIFNEAFTAEDDVELWMLNHNMFYTAEENKEWENMYRNSPLGDKIKILPRQATISAVSALMRTADCGIFPSRGEGWNLEALEMLSCGRHLIITDYSGHTEFCTKENSRLIPIGTIEPAFDGKWFNEQGNWGLFGDNQTQATVNHMKEIHKLKQQGKLEVNHEGIKTAEHFTWKNTANCILEALKTIKGT